MVDKTEKKVNIEDVNSILGTLSGFIRNYINIIVEGINIGNPIIPLINSDIIVDLKQTKAVEVDHYIYFETTPTFKIKPHKGKYVRSNVKVPEYEHKPITYEQRVSALKDVLKLTPIYTMIQEMKDNEELLNAVGTLGHLAPGSRI